MTAIRRISAKLPKSKKLNLYILDLQIKNSALMKEVEQLKGELAKKTELLWKVLPTKPERN